MAEVLVEVSSVTVSGDVARRRSVAPESFADRAAEITDAITEVAEDLRAQLERNLLAEDARQWHLETVQLGFELALKAEAGVIIAKAGTEATFSAIVTWSRGGAK